MEWHQDFDTEYLKNGVALNCKVKMYTFGVGGISGRGKSEMSIRYPSGDKSASLSVGLESKRGIWVGNIQSFIVTILVLIYYLSVTKAALLDKKETKIEYIERS